MAAVGVRLVWRTNRLLVWRRPSLWRTRAGERCSAPGAPCPLRPPPGPGPAPRLFSPGLGMAPRSRWGPPAVPRLALVYLAASLWCLASVASCPLPAAPPHDVHDVHVQNDVRLAPARDTAGFERQARVFGAHVLIAPGVPAEKAAHVTKVLASVFDNKPAGGDGAADAKDVAESMAARGVALAVFDDDEARCAFATACGDRAVAIRAADVRPEWLRDPSAQAVDAAWRAALALWAGATAHAHPSGFGDTLTTAASTAARGDPWPQLPLPPRS